MLVNQQALLRHGYVLWITFSSGKSSSAMRLAGLFPLSIIAANLVALLIKSGKLVKLPLASASRTASISNRGGRRMADRRLNPGLGVLDGVVFPGCNELAAAYAPNIALAPTALYAVTGAGSSVPVVLMTGTSFSEEDDDLSIKPVPPARGEGLSERGESILLGIGHMVVLTPLLPFLFEIASIFGGIGSIFGMSDRSALLVVTIEGFALLPKLALLIKPLSSLSSRLDSLDSRPSSIVPFLNCP